MGSLEKVCRMRFRVMVAVGLVVLLGACAESGGQPAATEGPDGQSEAAAAPADGEREITGTFGGDPQLEGGCAWVDDGATRWNVQYPEDYTLSLDPPKLTGPGGLVVRPGDTITVSGAERTDIMTICQIGPVWMATSVTAAGK